MSLVKTANLVKIVSQVKKLWRPWTPSEGRQPSAGQLSSSWKFQPGWKGQSQGQGRCFKSIKFRKSYLLLTTAPLWRFLRPSTVLPFLRITASRGSLVMAKFYQFSINIFCLIMFGSASAKVDMKFHDYPMLLFGGAQIATEPVNQVLWQAMWFWALIKGDTMPKNCSVGERFYYWTTWWSWS